MPTLYPHVSMLYILFRVTDVSFFIEFNFYFYYCTLSWHVHFVSASIDVADNAQAFPALSLHIHCSDIYCLILRAFISYLVVGVSELSIYFSYANLDSAVVFLSAIAPADLVPLQLVSYISFGILVVSYRSM